MTLESKTLQYTTVRAMSSNVNGIQLDSDCLQVELSVQPYRDLRDAIF